MEASLWRLRCLRGEVDAVGADPGLGQFFEQLAAATADVEHRTSCPDRPQITDVDPDAVFDDGHRTAESLTDQRSKALGSARETRQGLDGRRGRVAALDLGEEQIDLTGE